MTLRIAWAAAWLLSGAVWAVPGSAGGQDARGDPLVGSWMAIDPATGIREVVTVTPETFTFGSTQTAIRYRAERSDDKVIDIYLGNARNAAVFTLLDDLHAQLSVPGGPTISLQRDVALPVADGVIQRAADSLIQQPAQAIAGAWREVAPRSRPQ